ncbi:Six-hairpin glycosidase [Atractiella rhizophila]|nr:Six-hairpin glycosidase [Atractiella rhizophila]
MSRQILFLTLWSLVASQNVTWTNAVLNRVESRLRSSASKSWELGTAAEVLTEYHTPNFAVYDSGAVPPSHDAPSSLDAALDIAKKVVSRRQDGQPLMQEENVGDPPSIGVSVLVANITNYDKGGPEYGSAADDQLQFTLTRVPRTQDGAISHHQSEVSLWSDSVYMTPPFIAYYGALRDNATLLQEAYDQCRLYRQYLQDNSTGGIWRHIAFSGSDSGHWTTGNGWAANGLLRTYATIKHSSESGDFEQQTDELLSWAGEILTGIYAFYSNGTLFRNYVSDSGSFEDAAGTTAIVAATYRYAALSGNKTYIPQADSLRALLANHVDKDGWLQPVVDPYSYTEQGSHSPEAQAFVLAMQAAYVANGGNGPSDSPASPAATINMMTLTFALIISFTFMSL